MNIHFGIIVSRSFHVITFVSCHEVTPIKYLYTVINKNQVTQERYLVSKGTQIHSICKLGRLLASSKVVPWCKVVWSPEVFALFTWLLSTYSAKPTLNSGLTNGT